MKVANYNKKALNHNYSLQLDPAPPHRQVKRRMKKKEDNDNMIEGKGSISFLIPVKATAKTAVGESGKATRQLQQKRANRKTARAQRRRENEIEQASPTKQTIHTSALAPEKEECTFDQLLARVSKQLDDDLADFKIMGTATDELLAKATEVEEDERDESWSNNANAGPTAILDSGATSSCGKLGDPFLTTGVKSGKIFQMPNGHKSPASELKLLEHDLRSPAREAHGTGAKRDITNQCGKASKCRLCLNI